MEDDADGRAARTRLLQSDDRRVLCTALATKARSGRGKLAHRRPVAKSDHGHEFAGVRCLRRRRRVSGARQELSSLRDLRTITPGGNSGDSALLTCREPRPPGRFGRVSWTIGVGRRRSRTGRCAGLSSLSCSPSGPCVSGCLGPKAVQYTRLRYNEVVRDTNDEQLLINIVRLRYADSPVFIDLPSITSQFEVAGGGNYIGGYGYEYLGRTSLGSGQLSMRDTPTLSYHPREGREIAKSLLTPLSADLFIVVNAGADIEQLLLLATNDINDVPNAPRSTTLTPKVPDDNSRFVEGIRILASLREHDGTELAFGTVEEADGASDPIPKGSVQGRDLLNAGKDGYVYRAKGKGQVTLLKREKDLVSEDPRPFRPLARDGGGRPDISPQAGPEHVQDQVGADRRSLPETTCTEPGGERHDLHEPAVGVADHDVSLEGCVRSRRSRDFGDRARHSRRGGPAVRLDAESWQGTSRCTRQSTVPRTRRWPSRTAATGSTSPSDDVKSRAVLAILEVFFALQESADKPVGPLLTLPLGGCLNHGGMPGALVS